MIKSIPPKKPTMIAFTYKACLNYIEGLLSAKPINLTGLPVFVTERYYYTKSMNPAKAEIAAKSLKGWADLYARNSYVRTATSRWSAEGD